ncbi:MAG TPA: WD40 repeat domain-containing protein [Anaerolineales bacterium]
MSKPLHVYLVISGIACTVLFSACSPQFLTTPGPVAVPIRTEILLPATSLASSSPEPTLVPENTPVPSSTPMQWPSRPITKDNAGEIHEINRWGRGSVQQIKKLNRNQDEFLVLTPLGVYLYQTTPPYILTFIPDVDEFILSPDEHWLATSLKNGNVQIWSIDEMSLKQTVSHSFPEEITKKIEEHKLLPYYVGGMAFSPDNSEIAIGYIDGTVELRRIGEPDPYATLRNDAFALWQTDIGLVFRLRYSSDGKTLAVFKFEPYTNANRLTFWSLPEAKLISVSEAGRFYDFVEPAYLPDNQTLLVFCKDDSYLSLTLWNIQTGAKMEKFDTGLSKINSTELATDGQELTIYGSDTQENYYRQVRRLPEGDLLQNEKLDELPQDKDLVRLKNLLFEQGHYYNSWGDEESKDAKVTILGNQGFRVLGESDWLTFPEEIRMPLNMPEDVTGTFYDPHGQYIAWCTPGKLNFLDQNGKTTIIKLPFIRNCDGVTISPQMHYAAIWYGESMYIANLKAETFSKLSFHRMWKSSTIAAGFSHDEKILISSRPGLMSIWQVDPPQKLTDSAQVMKGMDIGNNIEIVISSDKTFAVTLNASNQIGSSRESALMVWRIEDAFAVHRINPPLSESSQPKFTSFALSPDDKLIASGDDFGGIRLWSVTTGEEVAFFDIDARPLDLAFTPNGSGLIGVLADGTIRLWGLP